MTPEPLKGKKDYVIEDCKDTFFAEEDVKSAVEWLKECFTEFSQDNWDWNEIKPYIDEAFEDVMK